ncbi:MAG: hypothetical protein QOE63_858 [Acidimicrobiaceae bacterium]
MPTYEYRCKDCGDELEVVQSFTDDALTKCPTCGGNLRKVFGNVGITFKGSGFYKTDSRAGGSKKRSEGKESSDSSSSEGKSSDGKSSDDGAAKESAAKDSSPKDSGKKDGGGDGKKADKPAKAASTPSS